MAKFDSKQIIKGIQKNTEYGVIALLAMIGIIMILILSRQPNITKPPIKTIDITKIPFPKEAEAEIKKAVEGLKPLDQSNYQKDLLQRNLFSFRDVLSKQALEKEISDKLKRAQTLFDQGSYQQASDLCDEILRSDPNREPARVLKENAQKKLQAPAISTSTTR